MENTTPKERDLLQRALTMLRRVEDMVKAQPDAFLLDEMQEHLKVMNEDHGYSTKYNSRCIKKANPDEPIFVLRAKDPLAPIMIKKWLGHENNIQPVEKKAEAERLASHMENWYEANVPENEKVDLSGKFYTPPATLLMDSEPLKMIDLKERAMPFFNDKVKAFHPAMNTVMIREEDNMQLWCQFMGMQGQGELTDDKLKMFCDKVNMLVEEGAIEWGCLSHICMMPITDKKEFNDADFAPEAHMGAIIGSEKAKKKLEYFRPTYEQRRWMVLFYPMSRFTTEELRKRYPVLFNNEGELPAWDTTAKA